MKSTCFFKIVMIVSMIVGAADVINAAIMDSADFDWKYEMSILPDAEDLDSDTNPDWVAFGNPWTLSGSGTATYSSTESGLAGFETIDIYNLDTNVGTGNVEGHFLDGYTFEYRVKVPVSHEDRGSFGTANSVVGGSGTKTAVSELDTKLGNGFGVVDSTTNNDGFHVFRVAQEGTTGLITMWRDGVNIANGVNANFSNGAVFFDIGDFGHDIGTDGGVVEVDYFRWTTGAFSPVPEPASMVLLGFGLVIMVAKRRKS